MSVFLVESLRPVCLPVWPSESRPRLHACDSAICRWEPQCAGDNTWQQTLLWSPWADWECLIHVQCSRQDQTGLGTYHWGKHHHWTTTWWERTPFWQKSGITVFLSLKVVSFKIALSLNEPRCFHWSVNPVMFVFNTRHWNMCMMV